MWRHLAVIILLSSLLALAASPRVPAASPDTGGRKPYVLVWMCLDICEPGQNEAHLRHVQAYRSMIDAVSYEAYIVAQGGLLQRHPRVSWDVTPELQKLGVETWPMIVSANIENIRAVFDGQESFIAQAVGIALSLNITGFNIDFEPTGGATHEDAVRFAEFLDRFAAELHKHGFKLSVDVARWSPIWDLDLISRTRVDYIIDMSTYASRDTTFIKYLDRDLVEIPEDKLVIGLCTYNLSSETLFPEGEVAFRFAKLINRGVERIAIWRTMLPVYWWRYIRLYREALPLPATITRLGAVTVTATETVTETATTTSTVTMTSTHTTTYVSTSTVSEVRTFTVTSVSTTTATRTVTETSVSSTTVTSTATATITSTVHGTTTLREAQHGLTLIAAAAAFVLGAALCYIGRRR